MYRLGDMKVSECKFYDSKMRPLLLVYDNPDTLSVLKDVRIMFKHGDGMYTESCLGTNCKHTLIRMVSLI